MQKLQFILSALLCALSTQTLISMEELLSDGKEISAVTAAQQASGEQATVKAEESLLDTARSLFHLKALLMEIAALFSDDADEEDDGGIDITPRKLAKLCLYVRTDKLLTMLSLDPKVVKQHITLKGLKKYLGMCVEEVASPRLKAAALKKVFKKKLWEDYFQYPELKQTIETSIDLLYATGTDEEKIALHAQLKEQLDKIKAIANSKAADHPLKKYCSFFPLLLTLDNPSEKIRFFDLLNCFKLDELIDTLPQAFSLPEDTLSSLFKIDLLKKLLREYQSGKMITPDDLKAVLKLKRSSSQQVPAQAQMLALGKSAITADTVGQWLDFPWLCEQLNNLRDGKAFDRKGLQQRLKVIDDFTGLDITGAFNSDLPEQVQLGKVEDLVNTVNDPTAWTMLQKLQYGLPFLGIPVVLYLAGLTATDAACSLAPSVCAPLIAVSESLKRWYITGPLTAVATYGLVKATQATSQFFEAPSRMKYALVNAGISIAATKLIRGASAVQKQLVTVASLHKDIPEGHKLHAFCDMITDEHIQQLPRPEALLHILDRPLSFMMAKEHENFLLGLCSIDTEGSQARVKALINAVNDAMAKNKMTNRALPHYTAYTTFISFCELSAKKPLSALTYRGLADLGLFNPRLLLTQVAFMRTLHSTIAGNKSLSLQLWTAIEKADMLLLEK